MISKDRGMAMKRGMVLAFAGSLVLAACGDKGAAEQAPPEKPQPGSWTQKIEVLELSGEGAPANAREELNAMFAELGNATLCITPELADRMDIAKRVADLASQGGDCRFGRRISSGKNVDFSATCEGPSGSMTIAGKGISGTTAQDVTATITGLKPDGSVKGKMVWHVTGERKGECGPDDIVIPVPEAPVAKI